MSIDLVDVVICADNHFALGAWVAIWSTWARCSEPERLRFHLLTTTPNGPAILKLTRLASLSDICLSVLPLDHSRLLGLPASQRLPISTYMRLLASDALKQVSRFLYLDSDLLVRTCILHLVSGTAWGSTIAGSCDYFYEKIGRGLATSCGTLGLDENDPYVNCGVLAVDAERWRTLQTTAQVFRYLEQFRAGVIHGDQDGINAVLSNDCEVLDASWNVQVAAVDYFDRTGWPEDRQGLLSRRDELLSAAKIAHFVGPSKPWNDGLFVVYGGEYRTAILASRWVGQRAATMWKLTWYCQAMIAALQRRMPNKV